MALQILGYGRRRANIRVGQTDKLRIREELADLSFVSGSRIVDAEMGEKDVTLELVTNSGTRLHMEVGLSFSNLIVLRARVIHWSPRDDAAAISLSLVDHFGKDIRLFRKFQFIKENQLCGLPCLPYTESLRFEEEKFVSLININVTTGNLKRSLGI